MAKKQIKRKKKAALKPEAVPPKDFLDMIAPAAVKFNTDSYILGGAYHCTLAAGLPHQHRGTGPAPASGREKRRDSADLYPPGHTG